MIVYLKLLTRITSLLVFMKHIPLFLAITLGLAHGKSNSSGPDSPVLYGEIIAVSDDRKTVTILQAGSDERDITITKRPSFLLSGWESSHRS